MYKVATVVSILSTMYNVNEGAACCTWQHRFTVPKGPGMKSFPVVRDMQKGIPQMEVNCSCLFFPGVP
jgi:hypothetical protein